MPIPKTPAQDPVADAHIPIGTPPGGGCWTWSAEQRAWVQTPASAAAPQDTQPPPQE